jgi:hypothetical protein
MESEKENMRGVKERLATDLDKRKEAFDDRVNTGKVLKVSDRVDLGYILDYVVRTRALWDTDDDITDVTSENTDAMDGIPITHESDSMEKARWENETKKELTFSARAHVMVDKALKALKGKYNVRNFPRTVQEAAT